MSTDEVSKLFREEVFHDKQNTWLANIVLVRPLSFWMLALGASALASLVIIFLVWGSYTRKAKATGYVMPVQGLIKIASQQTGQISDLKVKEGQLVDVGQVMAVLSTERNTINGGAQAELGKLLDLRRDLMDQDKKKSVVLYNQQINALKARIASTRGELQQVERTVLIQSQRVEISEKLLEKQKRLHAEKFITEITLQQKEQEWLTDVSVLENFKRGRTSLERDLETLNADLAQLPAKQENELSLIARNQALLAQDRIENETRRETLLKAPQAGMVTAISAERGKLIVAGQPILNLVPIGAEMQVEVYVPSKAVGFIREGSKTLLQFQAFPYQKFGSHNGTVLRISRTAVTPSELPFPAQQGDLYYVAVVELEKQTVMAYGKKEPLQSGMVVDASILLDRRTLLEWTFEPLYSISGRWER
jgi:membrane fusion protein